MPTATYSPDVTDKFTTLFIRRTARRLVADGVMPESELEDTIQDLTLALLERLPSFDPERAKWSTFVKNIVHRQAVSLVRRRQAECRGGEQSIGSLNVLIEGEEGCPTELGTTITEEEYLSGFGYEHEGSTQRTELELAIEDVLAGLPEESADLCRRLEHQSVSAVARELGVPRTTIVHRLKKMRARFAHAGLGRE